MQLVFYQTPKLQRRFNETWTEPSIINSMQLIIRIKQLLIKITNSNSNSLPPALVSKNPATPSPCILLQIHSRWWVKLVFCIDIRGWFERIVLMRIYRNGINEENLFPFVQQRRRWWAENAIIPLVKFRSFNCCWISPTPIPLITPYSGFYIP